MPQADSYSAGRAMATKPAPQFKERRSDNRIVTVCRHVKIEHGGDEGLARCRNISARGMALDTSIPLNLNDQVIVTFCRTELSGKVVWLGGNDCGIAFDEPVDCEQLLHNAALDTIRGASRPHRLKTNLPAKVAYEGRTRPTTVADVSVRGMKIAHDGDFQPGLHVRVILNSGCEKEGVVRWSRDNIAGIILLDPFAVEDLGSVQRLSCGSPP
jgi:hypothetical protein